MFHRWKSVFFLIPFLVASGISRAEPGHTNIVLIMADDLGYGDLGCYGSKINETPNLDHLARGGLRFTDFHSSAPICSPTRAATLTGLYQNRFGVLFEGAFSKIHLDGGLGLPSKALTISEVLKENQYATACFGKWHLGFEPPLLPTSHGFDVFRGLSSGDGDFHTHIDRFGNDDWWHNNEIEPEAGYTTDLLTKYSVEFIEEHQGEPFFLYVPHLAIHFPWQGPLDPPQRQKGGNYRGEKWGIIPDPDNIAPHVKAMIESLDDSVGEIVKTLNKLDLRRNTLIVFTSDNGGYLNYTPGEHYKNVSSNGALRGQKKDLYEGGHRVPTIFSWPGKIEAGVSDSLAHSTDLFPTFLTLCGISFPDSPLDGMDLSQHLLEGEPVPSRQLFWRVREEKSVRDGYWKLYSPEEGPAELYRLDNDISEKTNLAETHPDVVERLQSALSDWEEDVLASQADYQP